MNETPIINHKKCTLCGKCVTVCPRSVLGITNKKLEIVKYDCMLCAQCYDVCPSNAISFFEHALRQPVFENFKYSEKVIKPSEINREKLVNIFRSRRSVRKFRDKKVPDSALKDLLEFAVTAPSGSNRQDWEFIVINGREKVWDLAGKIGSFFVRINNLAKNPLTRYLSLFFMGKTLMNYYHERLESVERALRDASKGIDRLFWGAPALIIIHGPARASTPMEDSQFASYNIAVLARAFDLGTCYIGYAVEAINRDRAVKEFLGVPDNHRVHDVLTIGYPDVEYKKLSPRKNYYTRWL